MNNFPKLLINSLMEVSQIQLRQLFWRPSYQIRYKPVLNTTFERIEINNIFVPVWMDLEQF